MQAVEQPTKAQWLEGHTLREPQEGELRQLAAAIGEEAVSYLQEMSTLQVEEASHPRRYLVKKFIVRVYGRVLELHLKNSGSIELLFSFEQDYITGNKDLYDKNADESELTESFHFLRFFSTFIGKFRKDAHLFLFGSDRKRARYYQHLLRKHGLSQSIAMSLR